MLSRAAGRVGPWRDARPTDTATANRSAGNPDAYRRAGRGRRESSMETNTKNRGFASMAAEKQREIARKGGRAAHEKGKAHEFTTDEARMAGRKGGEKVSVDRNHMAEIGRRGGRSSASRRRANAGQTQPSPSGENSPDAMQPVAEETSSGS